MTRYRINVKNHETWGKLVKTWATGKNYVDYKATEHHPIPTGMEIPPKYPKPSSFKDFAAQCIDADVGLYFEDDDETLVTGNEDMGFVLLQVTPDSYVLRLPAKVAIERSEQQLIDGAEYELPDFYERIFEGPVKGEQVATALQRTTLHAERVGEYTINTCH